MVNLKIFTDDIEDDAISQVYQLAYLPVFKDSKIRIMPDVHTGTGCVIGFTADLGEKVIPNIVGVDIGCGMRVIKLGQIDVDLELLDKTIKNKIPSGFSVNDKEKVKFKKLDNLICYNDLKEVTRIKRSIGTLGGGNHFIEVDVDKNDIKYLIIHTGSRNLGKQVAEIYQKRAIESIKNKRNVQEVINTKIEELKQSGKYNKINEEIAKIRADFDKTIPAIPRELCYLEGNERLNYLHDMKICQEFAVENRKVIGDIICKELKITPINCFETIHNYISFEDNIVRKGAIAAKKEELLLIPMNMRDGCILGIGKGNEDWNNSAPHGAGRLMSRATAREKINLEDYRESMKGIYTTSVNIKTIDESPFAYKPMEEIVNSIKDTVEIIDILKPIYNFKASE